MCTYSDHATCNNWIACQTYNERHETNQQNFILVDVGMESPIHTVLHLNSIAIAPKYTYSMESACQ